ncbi:CAAX prenyl protease 1 [Kluyveromyces marxianus DMKU3-1042]|uniref:CAAX prenyl protease n=1 Tax=Kluyveromyces marxianus (strain DMKU3-1042 / BCC 29191 / NBRC 104275) TaxID=1003335 RepID=W0TED0_KLUMD|nr:CAAX prenyl protease 1 [Kluyveromyces marxianus DMKU3-1042]BAO41720.1 CAAX prenyl protease 1 [Kluyveromyces marxianus DMKU3-1042]
MGFVDVLQGAFDKPSIPWKTIITGFTVAQFAFETYLTYRQYVALSKKTLPPVLEGEIDDETFQKSEAYARAKSKFSIVSNISSLVQNLIFIKFDVLPTLWNLGNVLASYLPSKLIATSTIAQSLYFLNVLTALSTFTSLPLSYYQHFVLEEKFGFNKLTIKLWITDMIKSNLLGLLIGTPVLYLFLKIFEVFPSNFLWYICLFVLVVQILALTIIPVLIMPLFNKFTPLDDGELKTAIEQLAKKVGFPLDKIFVVDGSKRSSHSNAYFTGLPFTSKRIVLYDTLVNDSTTDEIVAVLAHEIGHWQKSHLLRMLAFSETHIFLVFSLFTAAYQNNSLYNAFHFFVGSSTSTDFSKVITPQFPVIIGFLLFNDLLQPLDCLSTFLTNLVSRAHEYQSDAYAKELGYANHLARALINLQIKNLSTMNVDPLYSSYHYSHPTLAERLIAIEYKNEKKAQ